MPHVVVIGAGYAGVHAARSARDAGAEVTLVDADGRHDLLPRLAQVAAGAVPEGDAWADAGALLPGVHVRTEPATRVDAERRQVTTVDDVTLHYDALVVTTGARAIVPDRRGLPLRTAGDALRLRDEIARADRLIVIGGGATGVQLAGGAKAVHGGLDVHLVERDGRILPEFASSLSRHAARVLRRRGVVLHTHQDAEITDGGVTLDSGEKLEGLVVWAAGYEADGNDLLPDAPTTRGRLTVDRELRVAGFTDVLAAGDVAHHRDLLGRELAMSAQIAVQAGQAAGRNAAAIAAGDAPAPAWLVDLGWVIDLGGGRGVARVGPFRVDVPVLDRLVPVLHGAVDVRHLWKVGGADAVLAHAPGQHDPSPAALGTHTAERGRIAG